MLDRCSLKKLKADIDTRKVKTAMVDDNGKSILYRKGNTDKQTHNRRSSLVKVFQMLSMYPNTSVSLTLHAVEFDTEGSLFQLYLV